MTTFTSLLLIVLCAFAADAQQRPGPVRPSAPVQHPAVEPQPGTNAPANRAQATATNNPAMAARYAITNALATMAPLQAQKVRQVQAGLNALQSLADKLGPVRDHLQDVIEKNPEIQQELKILASQINALCEFTLKPSDDMVERLSQDLLRGFSMAQLQPDQQLVIATVINSVCNSRDLSFAQVNEIVGIGVNVVHDAGVSIPESQLFGYDLRVIAYEVKPGLAR